MTTQAIIDLSLTDMPNWDELGFQRFTRMPLSWIERQHCGRAIVAGVVFYGPDAATEAKADAEALNREIVAQKRRESRTGGV